MSRNETPSEIDAMMDGVRQNLGMAKHPEAPSAEGSVSMNAVMRRVNDEVAKRLSRTSLGAGDVERSGPATGELPRWQPSAPRIATKREYALPELLAFSDADFVEVAYRTVLRRPSDADGFSYHLQMLRTGALSKVEVLAALRWSAEGEARGVHVDGLLAPFLLQKWRRKKFIGPVVAWCHALAGLGRLPSRLATLDAAQARESQEIGRLVNRLDEQVEHRLALLQVAQDEARRSAGEQADEVRAFAGSQVEGLAAEMARTLEAARTRSDAEAEARIAPLRQGLDIALARLEDRVARVEFESLINQIGAVVAGLQATTATLSSGSADAAARIEGLAARVAEVAAELARSRQLDEEALARAKGLDPLYAAFEDRFRGERSLVRARAEPYLALVAEAGAGGADAPVLDVGCGRGEWLELLREHGVAASGIDLNRVFIEACRARGLSVVEADAVEAMAQLADGSVGVLTSMHLVEHLEFETLVAFLDQAHRVLRPGGLILLETPNPENLSVASHWFYMDPTHRNPLPPEALRWLVEARGFELARIERQTVARELYAPPLVAEDAPGAASINVLLASLHAAPDYAIVARKALVP